MTRMLKSLLLALFLLPAALPGAAQDAGSQAAETVVQTMNEGLQAAMNGPVGTGYAEREAQLRPILVQAFDYPYMAQVAAGRYWKDFTPAQQAEYVALFEQVSIAAAASRFKSKPGSAFTLDRTREAPEGRRFVETTLAVPGREPLKIAYLLQQDAAGAWRAVDLFYNGTVSELATKRSEYTSVLKSEGLDSLLAKLAAKAAQYAAE